MAAAVFPALQSTLADTAYDVHISDISHMSVSRLLGVDGDSRIWGIWGKAPHSADLEALKVVSSITFSLLKMI